MPQKTEAEKQALYERDCVIINRQADERIAKLKAKHDEHNKKIQAEIDEKIAAHKALRDKRKAGIKKEWDQRLAAIRPGFEYKRDNINEKYDGLSDLADLEYDNWFDDATELQYKEDRERHSRLEAGIEIIEKWRKAELASELIQLKMNRQRSRKDN